MIRPQADLLRPRVLAHWWWLALLPVAWMSLFWRIGAQPIQTWDEARLAVNAAEMLRTGNWLVTHYQGEPDLWNTKPPLLIWLQAISLSLFGYSEWAFRLPTALAALALTGLIAVFARRWLGGPLAGLLAGLALLTSKGFVTHHVARTGDYESLLLLFTTAQVITAFLWLQTTRPRYLLFLGAAIGLAVLTKSVAGLFMLPGIALEIIRRGRLLTLFRQSALWGAVMLAIIPPVCWYVARELAAPGYWQAVWENELGGRLLGTLEQHKFPWYWYLTSFVSQQFLLWTPWIMVSVWALAQRPVSRPAHRFLSLAAWAGGLFYLIISASGTKLTWYDAPIYPLLALIIGSGLAILSRRVANQPRYSVLLLLVAIIPSAIAMQKRLSKEYNRRYSQAELTYGKFLNAPAATAQLLEFTALHHSYVPATRTYNASLEFYALAFRAQHPNQKISVQYDVTALASGSILVVCGQKATSLLDKEYSMDVLHASDSCATVRLRSRR